MLTYKGKKLPLVLVEWVDSMGVGGNKWSELETHEDEKLTCYSVGWLTHEGDNSIVISPHISDPEHDKVAASSSGTMSIPRQSINKFWILEESQ